jgi:serine/threonine-protein kinase
MPRPSLEIGSTLASYTIEALLGQGGMGSVYLATQKHLKRKAALKVLSPEFASDEAYRRRFLRECELIAQLEHPNIVPIYDAGEADGLLYLAMRYIKGTDLRALIGERGHLSAESTLAIIEQIASALDAAHAAGVIHRDVKPANILIERPGERAYLSDFGVAKSLSSDGLTRTGTFLGTVDYCAPEQISGKPIDARADVYSLGGVLYHCLAGQPPYIRETQAAVINAHVSDRPPALSGIRPDLPPALDGVVATAMAKVKEVRYSSAGELASAFRSALTEESSPQERGTVIEPSPTTSPTAVQGSPLPQTVIEAASPGPPLGAASTRRSSIGVRDLLVILVAVGFVLAAAAALSFSLLHGGKAKTASKPVPTTPVTTTHVTQTVKKRKPAAVNASAFVGRVEGFLAQSANGRREIVNALAQVGRCSISPSDGAVRVSSVARNRQSVLNQLAALRTPTAQTARIAELLQGALRHSVEADRHYRDWLRYGYSQSGSCSPSHDSEYSAGDQESYKATTAKKAFLRVFNPLARRFGRRTWTEIEI